MSTVTIVDYGCGNILSIAKAIEACDARVILTRHPEEILKAERLILPGVGAFGYCISMIKNHSLHEVLKEYIQSGKPVLGICVGMQMLLTLSYEYGEFLGLDIISGTVSKIITCEKTQYKKVPFVGWSKLEVIKNSYHNFQLFPFLGQWFYFVHSFVARPLSNEYILGNYFYYEEKITAIIAKENVIGCQFHPEKSGLVGLKFLEQFIKW